MTLSFWRLAHLSLAVLAAAFLLVASITGIYLAYDAGAEKLQPFYSENSAKITMSETISVLKNTYPEITEITVDHNGFVLLDGADENGDPVKIYVDPKTGKKLGNFSEKSEVYNWMLALHRSLFLKETGRFAVGVISAILVLITVSGLFLLLKRQKSFINLFSKIKKDNAAQFYHIVLGRFFLIPIFITALSATYLFIDRFQLLPKNSAHKTVFLQSKNQETSSNKTSNILDQLLLQDSKKIEFPFIEDDPEEYFTVQLQDKTLEVHQISGQIVSVEKSGWQTYYKNLSLDWHTGRGSIFWSFILGISAISIVAFIISGFVITFHRSRTKIRNRYSPNQSEFIVLFGSENGSTLSFANKIHQQFFALGKKSFIADLNDFQHFPAGKHLLIFTSTYGLGDAPANAKDFVKKLQAVEHSKNITFSVVGFGSSSYSDFCAFAGTVQDELQKKNYQKFLPLFKIDNRSADDFAKWVKAWSEAAKIPLNTLSSTYTEKQRPKKKFVVVSKTEVDEHCQTIKISLHSQSKCSSGDLLAVYPDVGSQERLYSIGKVNENIQLLVKIHPNGLGSGFLNQLKVKDTFEGKIIQNKAFHLPKNAKNIAMICNGTGIAPFLGMISENNSKQKIHLYCGFRNENSITKSHQEFAEEHILNKKLASFAVAFSREMAKNYVMDLVQKDQDRIFTILQNSGAVMICGSLQMQRDVELVLGEICKKNNADYDTFKQAGQIFTDCY